MAVFESQHPLIQHKISLLREEDITVKAFRELANEIATILTVEATTGLALKSTPINCWSGTISAPILADKNPTLVPILRAGLGMLDGALE